MHEKPLQPVQSSALSVLFAELDRALPTAPPQGAERWQELDRHLGLLRTMLASAHMPRRRRGFAGARASASGGEAPALF
jgi:hypothetical protein